MCAGWISPPQRNPVCVLELYQLCFLMLCDLICPVLLLLALRLIFNMCFACASTTEPVCQMALRLGRRSMHNTLYLAAHCFSYSSGTKLGARASPLTTVPTVCNLFFTALFLADSLNMSGKWFTVLPDSMKVHLPCYQVELASVTCWGSCGSMCLSSPWAAWPPYSKRFPTHDLRWSLQSCRQFLCSVFCFWMRETWEDLRGQAWKLSTSACSSGF